MTIGDGCSCSVGGFVGSDLTSVMLALVVVILLEVTIRQ